MTEQAYLRIRSDAEKAAGKITDLSQRAMVYHHLYTDSQGNHTFPLLAAHGALWGSHYFRRGNEFGRLMSYKYALFPNEKKQRLEALASFADAFREINRRVCVETYTSYYYTKEYGENEIARQKIPASLLKMLMLCHKSRECQVLMSSAERKALFEAFFLWEQDVIVGPAVNNAHVAFQWQCMRFLAMKPVINFAYFPMHKKLPFWNFASKNERIKKGRQAFEIAENRGWLKVENALLRYNVLPEDYLDSKDSYQSAALASNQLINQTAAG